MNTAGTASARQLCILVLGMHRSGTSAVTRVLSLMGAALPRDLMPADVGNDTGHWEPATLSALNDRILASLDRTWHDWRRIDRPVDRSLEAELAQEIGWQFRDRTPFLIKDPRVCLLVPCYAAALEAAGAEVLHLFVMRNPMASSASLQARDGMGRATGQLLWLRYLLEAERATRGTLRRFVAYDDVLADWREALAPVAGLAGLPLPQPGTPQAEAIDAFLDRSLRHQTSTQISAADPMRGWLVRAMTAFKRLAADPEDPEAESALDDVHGQLDAATSITGATADEIAGLGRAPPPAAGAQGAGVH